jgi:hypothetical protein
MDTEEMRRWKLAMEENARLKGQLGAIRVASLLGWLVLLALWLIAWWMYF